MAKLLCDSMDSGISGVLVGECTTGDSVDGAGVVQDCPLVDRAVVGDCPLVGGAVVGDSTVH